MKMNCNNRINSNNTHCLLTTMSSVILWMHVTATVRSCFTVLQQICSVWHSSPSTCLANIWALVNLCCWLLAGVSGCTKIRSKCHPTSLQSPCDNSWRHSSIDQALMITYCLSQHCVWINDIKKQYTKGQISSYTTILQFTWSIVIHKVSLVSINKYSTNADFLKCWI